MLCVWSRQSRHIVRHIFSLTVSWHKNHNRSAHQIVRAICFCGCISGQCGICILRVVGALAPSALRLNNSSCCPDNLSFKTTTSMTARSLFRIAEYYYQIIIYLNFLQWSCNNNDLIGGQPVWDESENCFVSLFYKLSSFCLVQTNIVYCWKKSTTIDLLNLEVAEIVSWQI